EAAAGPAGLDQASAGSRAGSLYERRPGARGTADPGNLAAAAETPVPFAGAAGGRAQALGGGGRHAGRAACGPAAVRCRHLLRPAHERAPGGTAGQAAAAQSLDHGPAGPLVRPESWPAGSAQQRQSPAQPLPRAPDVEVRRRRHRHDAWLRRTAAGSISRLRYPAGAEWLRPGAGTLAAAAGQAGAYLRRFALL